MLKRVHHVGLVVPDIRAALDAYAAVNGARITEPWEVPGRHQLLAYVEFDNAWLELVQPLSPDTVSGRFLAQHPDGGLYHVAWEVDDVIAARDALLCQGATIMGSPEPRTDRDGSLLVVLDASRTHGTLIELRQPREPARQRPIS